MPDPARRRQRRGRGRVQQRVRRLRRHPGLDLHLGRAAARRARPRGGSAQTAGVDAGGGGILGGGGNPLTAAEPERYGELAHPGDDHSYDPFAQIGALVSTVPGAGTDPLGGLPRDHVLAIGESQSAFRLTTFITGVHPRTPVFDGFLVHSRGGGAAPLRSSPGEGLASSIAGEVRIRDDLDVPVLVFSTETDLTLLGCAPARQPDRGHVRSWEVALAHLVDWVVDGTEPPSGMPIEVLAERHGDRAGYLEQHEAALDGAIVAGFLLEAGCATAVAEAEEVDFG